MEGIDTVVLARVYTLVAEIEIVKTEVEGMKAENAKHKFYDSGPKYTEADFGKKAEELRSIWNELTAYGRG